jgi:MFS family permease
MLIVSRSAQGIGGAILFATSLALLAQSFHGKERGMAFGIWGAVTGVAAGLGPVLGGVITTGISWRGIFLVNLPVGVAALVVTRWQVDESKTPHASRPDWAGFATLTAGLVSLVYGLIRAGEMAWSDTGVAICLALAACSSLRSWRWSAEPTTRCSTCRCSVSPPSAVDWLRPLP